MKENFPTIMLKEQKSFFYNRNVDFLKYKFGSNYVPGEIAISMKEEQNNREVIGVIENDVDDFGKTIQEYN